MGNIIHGKRHGNMEHLAGQHVDVIWNNAFGNGLIEHSHVKAVVSMQGSFGESCCAARVQDQYWIGATNIVVKVLCRSLSYKRFVGSVCLRAVFEISDV